MAPKIDLKMIIESTRPDYFKRFPGIFSKFILSFLERLLYVREINHILSAHQDKNGFEFIEELFEHLDFSYYLSGKDRLKIPSEGKLICVANHPLGALDGLSILKAIGEVRRDVRIVVDNILLNIENVKDLLLPYSFSSSDPNKIKVQGVKEALMNEQAIIMFPSPEVSRLGWNGIRDFHWQKGPVYFARKYQAPILPIYVKGYNSLPFYLTSWINKGYSSLLLVHEVFAKRGKAITLKIGDPIPVTPFKTEVVNPKAQTRLLKKHVYQLAKNKKGIYKTEKTIIHPVDRMTLKNELAQARLLTQISDGKRLYQVDFSTGAHIVKEISRLRELTFRKVGEGTGKKSDFDAYDRYYKHIVLWDNEALEIIGSYRLGVGQEIIQNHGTRGFYNASLFHFSKEFEPYLQASVELGRSFIQQKYWRTNALDNLWLGLAQYISQFTSARYLFGAVSISNSYSEYAKALIVFFYKKWFGDPNNQYVSHKNKYIISKNLDREIAQILNEDNFDKDFRNLKLMLKNYGYTVPILFRRYSELCEPGGVKFLDFGVDTDFSDVVDGFIFLDLEKLDPKKRERYFQAAVKKEETGEKPAQ